MRHASLLNKLMARGEATSGMWRARSWRIALGSIVRDIASLALLHRPTWTCHLIFGEVKDPENENDQELGGKRCAARARQIKMNDIIGL